MATVDVKVSERVAKLFAANLGEPVQRGAMAIAAAIQHEVAPYPPPPPRRPGKGYYVRGRGMLSSKGKLLSSSEMLGRKWSINAIAWGARLTNTASYAGWVHGKRQARIHKKTGWVTQRAGIDKVLKSGNAKALMLKAITEGLG
jgi:hypothetical protein